MSKEIWNYEAIDAFYNLVPVGIDNGISIAELSKMARLSPRKTREMISGVNTSGRGMIINLSDGKGYFRASDDEKYAEKKYHRQEQSRFVSQKDKLEGINRYLGKVETKKGSELDDMQMDIFQYLGDG